MCAMVNHTLTLLFDPVDVYDQEHRLCNDVPVWTIRLCRLNTGDIGGRPDL